MTTDRAGHTEVDAPGAAVEREAAVMGGLGVEQLDHLGAVTGFFVLAEDVHTGAQLHVDAGRAPLRSQGLGAVKITQDMECGEE